MHAPFLSPRRIRRLGTLLTMTCVSAVVIALAKAPDAGGAVTHASAAPASTPTPSAAPHASPSHSTRPLPQVSATCTGRAKNMYFTAAGGSITDPSTPPAGYLRIKKASVVRNGHGVTVSYTLAADPPQPGSGISDAQYFTWLGDGTNDMDEPAVSLTWLDSKWNVTVDGTNDVLGGTVDVQPIVHGHTVSVHLPLRIATSSGYVADLSTFTHAGWSTEGKDPTGFGTWMDGCPTSGEAAGNPGDWEVKLR